MVNYYLMILGMRRMERAAEKLTYLTEEPHFEIHFLTGKKFLFQTLFCIYSLERYSRIAFCVNLYDDGSFDDQTVANIKKQLPHVKIHLKPDIDQRLKEHLPQDQFPYLNHKRNIYPHIKKLTDIHCGNPGWKLVLDSDMLFRAYPSKIIQWMRNPAKPIYMLDSNYAYGFPKKEMEKRCKTGVPHLLNVGVIGLNSEIINWQKVENWAKDLEGTFGNSYYLEQALTAMILGQAECDILPQSEYVVYPKDINQPQSILLHFVDLSKALYFRWAWRKI